MADESENKKKSFVVYFDWEEALSYFNDAETGEIFRALFKYAKDGTEPEFSHHSLNAVFSFMRSALDRDKKAYEERCRKNKENGGKGGRPKKPNGFEENPKKPNGYFEKPKKPDNDNNNVNDNDNDNGIDNGNDNVFYGEASASEKQTFGTFQNVRLTLEEYSLLKAQFPDTYPALINKFSSGLKAKGYEYEDHYAALLLWSENEAPKQTETQQITTLSSTGNPFLNVANKARGF